MPYIPYFFGLSQQRYYRIRCIHEGGLLSPLLFPPINNHFPGYPPANPVFPTSGSVKAPVAFASSTLASIITDIDGAIFVHVSA